MRKLIVLVVVFCAGVFAQLKDSAQPGPLPMLATDSLIASMPYTPPNPYEALKASVLSAADTYVGREASQGFGQPYAPSSISYDNSNTGYIWGSNSFVADNSIVISYAYLLSDDEGYIDGVTSGLDYLLGRNPMNLSYVTGYGSNTAHNPHHRFWANSLDPSFPSAPSGVLVGGPNSGMEDPYVQSLGWQPGVTPPATCYADNIEAYSVNECTINWNAPLCWVTAFVVSTSEAPSEVEIVPEEEVAEETSETSSETEATKAAEAEDAQVEEPVKEVKKGLPVPVIVIAGICGAGVIAMMFIIGKKISKK